MGTERPGRLSYGVPPGDSHEHRPHVRRRRYALHTVADAPTDPKQFLDPSVLVFAYTPVEDPEVYRKVWDGFLHHVEKVTGKRVQFFAVQSNAAQIEAMRAGRLHVAGFNTGSNPIAVNCAGFVPFAMMASKAGAYGYEMEIIVPGDSATSRARPSRSPIRIPTPATRRRRRCCDPSSGWNRTGTTSRRFPANMTIPCWVLPTRIMMRGRWRTRSCTA